MTTGSHYGSEIPWGARVDDAWAYRGNRVVVLQNEILRVEILADKGADVCSLLHKPTDTELLWRSPWGTRDPRTARPSAGDDVGAWLDHYEGGWQTIVPNGGEPATAAGGARFGLHAESSLLPWDVEVLEHGPTVAAVRLRVRLLRTPLTVTKEFRLHASSPVLQVHERVRNESDQPVPVVYGQHIALGEPLLGAGALVDLPGATVRVVDRPQDDTHRLQAGATGSWPHVPSRDGGSIDLRVVPPNAGSLDLAFLSDLPAPWYAVRNPARGCGVAVRWPMDVFPHVWMWQAWHGGAGYPWWGRTCTLGLEPFSAATNGGLEAAGVDGSLRILAPGETLPVDMTVTALSAVSTPVTHVDVDGTASSG